MALPGAGGADRRRRLAIGAARTGSRRGGRRAAVVGGVRCRGLLVVRRLSPCAGTLLAGHRLDRPFQYWSWANFASVVCAIGLGSVAGIGRAFDIAAIRRRSGLHLLVLGALLAIVFADLTMLSKAETERIWLPFTIWLTARLRAAAAAIAPLVAGAQRRRRHCAEHAHSDELVTVDRSPPESDEHDDGRRMDTDAPMTVEWQR